jgi:ribosome maturation factor RimP
MAQAPESWIGETVDVAFYQQANRSGKLLEVNDDGIVLEEVSERDVEVTLHTFYPWNTLNYVRKEVRSAEGITPRRRGT